MNEHYCAPVKICLRKQGTGLQAVVCQPLYSRKYRKVKQAPIIRGVNILFSVKESAKGKKVNM